MIVDNIPMMLQANAHFPRVLALSMLLSSAAELEHTAQIMAMMPVKHNRKFTRKQNI